MSAVDPETYFFSYQPYGSSSLRAILRFLPARLLAVELALAVSWGKENSDSFSLKLEQFDVLVLVLLKSY